MCEILHAFFWKSSKLSNSGISLNWSTIDEVTTRNTTAYFFGSLCMSLVLTYVNIGVVMQHSVSSAMRCRNASGVKEPLVDVISSMQDGHEYKSLIRTRR